MIPFSPRWLALPLLLCGLLTATPATAQSEWGLDLTLIKPTGDLGRLFAASPGVRLTRTNINDGGLVQLRPTLGFVILRPRADTILNAAYVGSDPFSSGNPGDQFVGGFTVQERNYYFTGGTQVLFVPWREGNLRPYFLLDGQGWVGYISESVSGPGGSGQLSGGDYGMFAGAGAGAVYLTASKFSVHASVARYYGFTEIRQGVSYWNTSLGLSYLF